MKTKSIRDVLKMLDRVPHSTTAFAELRHQCDTLERELGFAQTEASTQKERAETLHGTIAMKEEFFNRHQRRSEVESINLDLQKRCETLADELVISSKYHCECESEVYELKERIKDLSRKLDYANDELSRTRKPQATMPITKSKKKAMPRKPKEVTHEQIRISVLILKAVKSQAAKEPLSKAEIAESLGLKTVEITSELNLIEKREWVTRRDGPEPRSTYFKMQTKGNHAIKAWEVLYG